MEIRLQQGQLGEFVPLIASVAELNPSIPSHRAVLAAAHLDAGDNVSARELVEAAEMDGFALPMDAAWLDGIVMYARPVIELHMSSAAKHLLELLAPYHQQVPNDSLMCHEPVAMFLGGIATVLGRHEEAEMYFAEAAELNAHGQMTFAEAHTNLLWGRMLRIRSGAGDNDRARVLPNRQGRAPPPAATPWWSVEQSPSCRSTPDLRPVFAGLSQVLFPDRTDRNCWFCTP